ncbi:MAG: alpha/beta hydrolase, partial [Eubacteriales bacterium]|nr:alpha/beta hydrolase [Eubacteriales bacterium]
MALTKEQRQEYLNIIWDTGNYRETQLKKDWIPEDYLANKDLITREEVVVGAPWVEVPVKCYISTAKEKTEKCPIHVNMHGGGFVYPQDNDDDMYCAHVAAKIHGIVVDIDYACTTDYAFPVALDQCYGVMKWVYENAEAWGGDKEKVSMGGHSAGG